MAHPAVIAVGALGSWLIGRLADQHGRVLAAALPLAVSGGVVLASPLPFDASPWLMAPPMALWGFAAVWDSAQFSAIVTEVVPRASGEPR